MQSDERPPLSRRAIVAAGAAAVPALVLGAGVADSQTTPAPPAADPGPSAGRFPNIEVQTHHGRTVRFYEDLIKGRIVTINFMSIRGDARYPVTDNLVKVQRILGDRVGRDVFMYSITLDPGHDTPERLHDFANERGVGPGWSFLTGRPEDLVRMRGHLFVRRGDPTGEIRPAAPLGGCCSVGLVRYGNERLGRWASFPARIAAESIAKRFDWIGMRGSAKS